MDPHYGMEISPTDSPLKKGAWSPEEDQRLIAYIRRYGIWNWTLMPTAAGLCRSGKNCRLRWMNYLRPGIKRGNFSKEEDETIIELHQKLGTRWSAIAASLPGRTDNEIKNYWHTHLKKRLEDSNNNSSQITSDFSLHISAAISPASPGGSCASTRDINGCSLDFTQLQSVGCNTFTMENFGYWLEDQNPETTFGDSQFGLPTLQELQEPTYSYGSNNFGYCVEDQNQETTFVDSEFGLPTTQEQQGPMYSYGSSTFDEEDELWLKCLIDADMTGISWPLYS